MRQIPKVNQDETGILKNIKCFALDMDGTIYLGEKWIDGAKDFLKKIEESGRQYVFLTNNSSKGPENYIEKLHKMGLDVGPEKIITSGQATIAYLKKYFPGKRVFLLGNDLLKAEFREAGIELVMEGPQGHYENGELVEPKELGKMDAQVVVTAFDTTLDYKKMCIVCDYVRLGLPYIATHPDYNCPTETGFIPDAGAIHAFIHASAFRYPDHIIGKPNGDIMEYLEMRTGIPKENTIMVGDRLYTDVAAGVKNGLYGMLVLSGEATMKDVEESEVVPHLIYQSVKELIDEL